MERKKSRIRDVQMDKLRGLLGIKRMDRVLNAQIREMCGVMKGWMKGLTEVFSDGSAILKEWRRIGLLNGYICGSVCR